jgi:sugar phosphate isomerase/epimerase
VRDDLLRDFGGTLRRVAALGYRRVELISFSGYAMAGFAPLAQMPPREIRRQVEDAGLVCDCCHFQFAQLGGDARARSIAFAQALGARDMIYPDYTGGKRRSLDETKAICDGLNEAAGPIHAAGLRLGFDNQDFEFAPVDGVIPYDLMLSRLDRDRVFLQLDIGHMLKGGGDPIAYLRRHGDRYRSLHIRDVLPGHDGFVAVGRGSVDWRQVFALARRLDSYYVEFEPRPGQDTPRLLCDSASYLRTLA